MNGRRPAGAALRALLLGVLAAGAAGADERLLSPEGSRELERWYEVVGSPGPAESFGGFLARTALVKRGAPYAELGALETDGRLLVTLGAFDCVTFIETALAVSRCLWAGRATESCFLQELVSWRYRNEVREDFSSRLHYFTDWIEEHARRGRLVHLTPELGGEPRFARFFYMTRRGPGEPAGRAAMAAIEERLSAEPHFVLLRYRVAEVLALLQEGDIVAIVGDKPGRLVTHAGILVRNGSSSPRLLHASTHFNRIFLTREDVSRYVLRRTDRRGIMVARPVALSSEGALP